MYSSVDQKPLDTAKKIDNVKKIDNTKKIQDQFCRAQFDYDAQGDQEISFKAGDLIKLLYEEDETWWCGEINGKKGMFPKPFVELITT